MREDSDSSCLKLRMHAQTQECCPQLALFCLSSQFSDELVLSLLNQGDRPDQGEGRDPGQAGGHGSTASGQLSKNGMQNQLTSK